MKASLMKSIFFHFSMPGAVMPLTSMHAKSSVMLTLKAMLSLLNPLISIKMMGFPVVMLVFVFGSVHAKSLNLMSPSYANMMYKVIKGHFKGVHESIKSVHHSPLHVTEARTSWICGHSIHEFLTFLFLVLASINLGGMVYGTWCPTTWFSTTIGLSLFMWLFTLYTSVSGLYVIFCLNMTLYEGEEFIFLAGFLPSGTPLALAPLMVVIEMMSWIIRFLSMGLRMAGNLVAGHVIFGIVFFGIMHAGRYIPCPALVPFWTLHMGTIVYTVFFVFELGVALMQAYVFTLLTSIFVLETESLH